jgi:hypothetical protein
MDNFRAVLFNDSGCGLIRRNWFDIAALVPYFCVRREKEMTDLYARHRTIDC